MRTKQLLVSCGILILFGAHQSSAEHLSLPFLKIWEAADGDTVGSSSSDAPGTDPETQKAAIAMDQFEYTNHLASVGRVRFNFPNRFLVYHHDTPDKYLFSKPVRAYSHGCMRVENPDKYAETLLSISQPAEGYTAPRIRSLYGRGEREVNLKNPIPVYLTYQTVFFDQAGQVQTRPDIYGLDKSVTALLRGETAVAHIPFARNYGGDGPVRAHAPSRPRYQVVQQPYSWDRVREPYFTGTGGSSYYYGYDRRGW